MDATMTESEELLRQTVRHLGADLTVGSVGEFDDYDDARGWKSLAETGLLGLRLPESVGGGAGSTFDEAITVEALAYNSLPVPYLGGAAFVGALLLAAEAPDETLSRLASGDLRCSVGLTNDLSTLWGQSPSKGAPIAFDSAGSAAAIILDTSDGYRLRSVALAGEVKSFDLTRKNYEIDPSQGVDVGPLGNEIAPEVFVGVMARLLTLVSADLVGVMDAGLATAVEYAATREQFGVPIATFQAIQHLCAAQLVSLEGGRSLTEYAAWAVDQSDAHEAILAARAAKAYCSRAGRVVTEAVVQVHGGMGFTWDCMAHVYLKRALTDAKILGDSASQIQEISALRGGRI
jgi:alkylation response protein AidB-like acyl-CoA dehydrogenase